MRPEIEAYVEAHIEQAPDYLSRLERDTNLRRVNGRMCSGHIQGRILKMLTQMINPGRVLELGTFTGYSALCIAEGLSQGASLVTIEKDDELEDVINETLKESPLANKIELRIGEALKVCREFPANHFDMIFIDADKREYPQYLEEALRLLKEGGYILADNTLWDGHVAKEDRHDRQTEGVREFNRIVAETPGLQTVILPIRDGLSIIRKHNPR